MHCWHDVEAMFATLVQYSQRGGSVISTIGAARVVTHYMHIVQAYVIVFSVLGTNFFLLPLFYSLDIKGKGDIYGILTKMCMCAFEVCALLGSLKHMRVILNSA